MIVFQVDLPERAQAVLSSLGLTVTREQDRIRIQPDGPREPARINQALVQAGIAVSHLATQHLTLEDLFLELTKSPTPAQEYASL